MISITDYCSDQIYPPPCEYDECRKERANAIPSDKVGHLHVNERYMVLTGGHDTLLFQLFQDSTKSLKAMCKIPDASDEKLCKELSFRVKNLQTIAKKVPELGHALIMKRLHKEDAFAECLKNEKYKKAIAPERQRQIYTYLDPLLGGMRDLAPIIAGYSNSASNFEALSKIEDVVERLKKERGVSDDL